MTLLTIDARFEGRIVGKICFRIMWFGQRLQWRGAGKYTSAAMICLKLSGTKF
jgi:hypothetical protein